MSMYLIFQNKVLWMSIEKVRVLKQPLIGAKVDILRTTSIPYAPLLIRNMQWRGTTLLEHLVGPVLKYVNDTPTKMYCRVLQQPKTSCCFKYCQDVIGAAVHSLRRSHASMQTEETTSVENVFSSNMSTNVGGLIIDLWLHISDSNTKVHIFRGRHRHCGVALWRSDVILMKPIMELFDQHTGMTCELWNIKSYIESKPRIHWRYLKLSQRRFVYEHFRCVVEYVNYWSCTFILHLLLGVKG